MRQQPVGLKSMGMNLYPIPRRRHHSPQYSSHGHDWLPAWPKEQVLQSAASFCLRSLRAALIFNKTLTLKVSNDVVLDLVVSRTTFVSRATRLDFMPRRIFLTVLHSRDETIAVRPSPSLPTGSLQKHRHNVHSLYIVNTGGVE